MLALLVAALFGVLGCVNRTTVLPRRDIPYLLTRPATVWVAVETAQGTKETKVRLRPGDVVADAAIVAE